MAMTYAALAKSLGLSLGRSAPSQSSISPAEASPPPIDVEPAAASTTSPESPPKDPDPQGSSSLKRKSEEIERPPSPPKKAKTNNEETPTEKPSEVGPPLSDSDAEGETDIASSCHSSPISASPIALEPEPQGITVKEEDPEETRPTIKASEEDLGRTDDKPPPLSYSSSEQTIILDESMSPGRKLRPLTDEQLNQAKVLVLDLLGWGVPPEYLLQRGISHALLYTVFTDLRLRLPEKIKADCVALVSTPT